MLNFFIINIEYVFQMHFFVEITKFSLFIEAEKMHHKYVRNFLIEQPYPKKIQPLMRILKNKTPPNCRKQSTEL